MRRTFGKGYARWLWASLLMAVFLAMILLVNGGAASTPNCPDAIRLVDNEFEIPNNPVSIDTSTEECTNSPIFRHLRYTIWQRMNMTKHLKKLRGKGITPTPTYEDVEKWKARKTKGGPPKLKKGNATWLDHAMHDQAVVNFEKKYWTWKKEQELANHSEEVRGLIVNIADTRRLFKYLKIDETERYSKGRIENELAALHLIADEAIYIRRQYIKRVLAGIDTEYLAEGVIVSSFNSPYRHLWDNFVCVADRFNFAFRKRVILLPVGLEDYLDLKKRGDIPGLLDPRKVVPKAFGELDQAGSATFGPAHKLILSVHFLIVADLIAMGISTLFMDIDVFLKGNPFPVIHNLNHRYPKDIWGVYDHRDDDATPLNGGFVMFLPTCKTKLLLATMTRLTWLLLQMGSGQRWLNLILNSKYFREVRVGTLPDKQFINGHQWHRHFTQTNGRRAKSMVIDTRSAKDMVMVHVSWTGPRIDKIYKLRSVGLWLLNATTGKCWDKDLEIPIQPYVKVPEKYDKNGKKNSDYYRRYSLRAMQQFINWTTLEIEDLG